MQPPNQKFFTLFSKACSNVVESGAILTRHRRCAELAKRCTTPISGRLTPAVIRASTLVSVAERDQAQWWALWFVRCFGG